MSNTHAPPNLITTSQLRGNYNPSAQTETLSGEYHRQLQNSTSFLGNAAESTDIRGSIVLMDQEESANLFKVSWNTLSLLRFVQIDQLFDRNSFLLLLHQSAGGSFPKDDDDETNVEEANTPPDNSKSKHYETNNNNIQYYKHSILCKRREL